MQKPVEQPFEHWCQHTKQLLGATQKQFSDFKLLLLVSSSFQVRFKLGLLSSMYACQNLGTINMKEGAEVHSPLQTVHLSLLKRILGLEQFSRPSSQTIWFHMCMSMARSSEHATGPFMASAFR
eukprot:1084219-Pelagomonas_calceolata.AAC.1